jgi:hypothetical protein
VKEEIIKFLLRGKRPKDMDYNEFKLKRKAIQSYLKRRRNGFKD